MIWNILNWSLTFILINILTGTFNWLTAFLSILVAICLNLTGFKIKFKYISNLKEPFYWNLTDKHKNFNIFSIIYKVHSEHNMKSLHITLWLFKIIILDKNSKKPYYLYTDLGNYILEKDVE